MDRMEQQAAKMGKSMEQLIVKIKEVDDRCVSLQENISTRELNLISFVGDQGSAIMKEIADHLDVPMSTATGIVDKLVLKKYLKRSHSQHDRRIVCIELAHEGQMSYELFVGMKADLVARILSLLDQEETSVFITLLEKITAGLHDVAVVE